MTVSGDQSSVRRPIIVTAMLLVAVAVLLVALRSWLERPVAEVAIDTQPGVAATAEPVEPASESEPAVEPGIFVRPQPAAIGVPAPVVTPSEPTTVVMLPARVASADPAAAAVTDAVQQATLRALRAMPKINVVEISPADLATIVPPNAGRLGEDNVVYLAVTRRYEGRLVAQISEQSTAESPFWSLSLSVRRPNGGGSNGGSIPKNGDLRMGPNAESQGMRFAERLASDANRVASDSRQENAPGRVAASARSTFMDTTRSEYERLRSFSQLLNGPVDSAAIATVVEMATRSASAETRQLAWSMLRRGAYDSALAQPLSYSLLTDVDAVVRKEAALALAAYGSDPAASAALAHASRTDSSPEVRLAARMATMGFDEQQAFRHETLLDRSLTPAERIAPTIVDASSRNMNPAFMTAGADALEEALAYAEIVTAIEDVNAKFRILSELRRTTLEALPPLASRSSADDAKIVNAVIEVSRHEDARVRRQALGLLATLTRIRGSTEARAVLESVLENEPDLAAELRIAEALASRSLPSIPAR